MKRGAALLLVLAGIAAFFYFGGEAEGPSETPDIAEPDVNEAAGGLAGFFNWLGDTVSGFSPQTWRIIVVLGLTAICVWVFRKVPVIVWLVLALVGLVVAVML